MSVLVKKFPIKFSIARDLGKKQNKADTKLDKVVNVLMFPRRLKSIVHC